MRISDWSSDVCSSDLMPPPALRVRRHRTWSPAVAAGKGPAARAHRARARVCACSAAGEPLPEPVAEVADFLRAHRMAHRILMPVEREAEPAQDFRAALAGNEGHHRVPLAMEIGRESSRERVWQDV